MSIKISADSTCDLSREYIEKYNIGIVPLYITMGGNSYRDGVDLTPDDIFAHVANGGNIATTSAVNAEEYLEFFREALKEHEGIVHFTISSEISCSYQNACLAAAELENVYVVDSRSLSTGISQLVLDAAEAAGRGALASEIADDANRKKEKLDVSFVVDTLEYLRKGGRCSSVVSLGANLLSLKPCIEMRGGSMGVGKKYRGQLPRCFQKYISEKLEDASTIDDSRIFITDSGISDELYDAVWRQVLECVPFKEVIHTRAGCTISNHCGPNCMGILFFRK